MLPRVHATSVVDAGATLAEGVVVGPLCVVGEGVVLGEGTELVAQATVFGPCHIGKRNRVYPHATLGAPPQDRSHRNELTRLVVGDDNVFRESVTVHRGTVKGGGVTEVGSGCLFMVGAHVAHDAKVADGVTLANYTSLGGHVEVGAGAVLGGHVAVVPFVSIGELSFAAGGAMIERKVPPFVIVSGDRARVRGLNRIGLERAGVPEASREALARAFRLLYGGKMPLAAGLRVAEVELGHDAYVRRLLDAMTTAMP